MQDENGTGLLHKAVYYNHRDIADWLMDKYPESMSVRDNVSTKLSKYPGLLLKRGKITLTIAHLKIALLGGNPEVGNSEYMDHQNCPPQLL